MGSIGIVHGRVKAFDAAAYDAVEHLTHLLLERLQAIPHRCAHGGKLRGSLPQIGLPVPKERNGGSVDGIGELLGGFLKHLDFLEQAAGGAPLLALPLLGQAFLQGKERRRPGECRARRRGGKVVRQERAGAVRARDGGDERPGGEVEYASHGVDRGGKASLVRARRGEPCADGLQLARGGPGAGHAPGEGAEMGGGGSTRFAARWRWNSSRSASSPDGMAVWSRRSESSDPKEKGDGEDDDPW